MSSACVTLLCNVQVLVNEFSLCNSFVQVLVNEFSLCNSMWFTIGSLMQQGSDLTPKYVHCMYSSSLHLKYKHNADEENYLKSSQIFKYFLEVFLDLYNLSLNNSAKS